MKKYERLTEKDWHKEKFYPRTDNERVIRKWLWDLENKIELGTLVELPCNVGDTVYKVVDNSIVEYKIHTIDFTILETKQCSYCVYCNNYELRDFDFFYKGQIGKDWFLTKEEAEARLKILERE